MHSATTPAATSARLIIGRPGDLAPIDEIHPVTGLGVWTGATPEDISRATPGARVMSFAEWCPLADAAEAAQFCQPPKEVDADRWSSLLECMYPDNWRGVGTAEESFMLAEPYTHSLRVCMVRIGERYAEMIRPKTTTHSALCDEARAALQA